MRGAENALMAEPQPPALQRRVMTLPILKLLGHQLTESGWLKNTQQTIWVACLTGFFSSARMGQLLCWLQLKTGSTPPPRSRGTACSFGAVNARAAA
jgi:hypothetical protein